MNQLMNIPFDGLPKKLDDVTAQHVVDNQIWQWIFDKNVDKTKAPQYFNVDNTVATTKRINVVRHAILELQEIGKESLLESAKTLCIDLGVKDNSTPPQSVDNFKDIARALVHGTIGGSSIRDLFENGDAISIEKYEQINTVMDLHYLFLNDLCIGDVDQWKHIAVTKFLTTYKAKMGEVGGKGRRTMHCLCTLVAHSTKYFKDKVRDISRDSYLNCYLVLEKPKSGSYHTVLTGNSKKYYIRQMNDTFNIVPHIKNLIHTSKKNGLTKEEILNIINKEWDSVNVDETNAPETSATSNLTQSLMADLFGSTSDSAVDAIFEGIPPLPPTEEDGKLPAAPQPLPNARATTHAVFYHQPHSDAATTTQQFFYEQPPAAAATTNTTAPLAAPLAAPSEPNTKQAPKNAPPAAADTTNTTAKKQPPAAAATTNTTAPLAAPSEPNTKQAPKNAVIAESLTNKLLMAHGTSKAELLTAVPPPAMGTETAASSKSNTKQASKPTAAKSVTASSTAKSATAAVSKTTTVAKSVKAGGFKKDDIVWVRFEEGGGSNWYVGKIKKVKGKKCKVFYEYDGSNEEHSIEELRGWAREYKERPDKNNQKKRSSSVTSSSNKKGKKSKNVLPAMGTGRTGHKSTKVCDPTTSYEVQIREGQTEVIGCVNACKHFNVNDCNHIWCPLHDPRTKSEGRGGRTRRQKKKYDSTPKSSGNASSAGMKECYHKCGEDCTVQTITDFGSLRHVFFSAKEKMTCKGEGCNVVFI